MFCTAPPSCRKDTHGVFSEPVDPEELLDYHDIIKQPMDYGTVRKKLDKGLYPDLEQFEVGVAIFWNRFLECDLLLVVRSEAASCPRGSESTSVDPINEEKLRNKSWIDAAGGITNKGRLYGVGKVGSALRLADAFPNLSSGRSTRESRENSSVGTTDTQLLQQQANIQADNEDDQQPSSAAGHYGNDY
ncbi:hypothetical protein Fmac_008157 [Flemingia macrophylla]|uniref:Bromo domain-containing protein n=1 Tax=Flemingia macrophylla TaxID=520843 RepID=A0ABD1MXH2_9FABA